MRVWPYSHRLSPRAPGPAAASCSTSSSATARSSRSTSRSPTERSRPGAAAGGARVAVFNLAQSPEQEVHGAFLEGLRGAAASGHAELLVLLDEEPYSERLGAAGAERVAQRRRAWERLAREAGLRTASLRAPGDGGGDALAEARAALASAGAVSSS